MAALKPAVSVAAKLTTSPLLPFSAAKAGATAPSDAYRSLRSGTLQLAGLRLAPQAIMALLTDAPSELPLLDVDFCGECVPFEQTDVADRWKRVFTLFRSRSRDLGILRERADQFFPIIDPILRKYDIPPDFRYVPLAESDLRPRAVSRSGAAGYWQLMPATARALGLNVTGRTDERFNVLKATEAACKYLRKLYDQLGSWSLVAAAYNAGPSLLLSRLKTLDHRDYYRLNLPRETRYYLFRVLVYKEMLSRPDPYSPFLAPAPLTTPPPQRIG